MTSNSVPLDTLAGEILACYKKGNDMLVSASQRMLEAKRRIDAGELGPDWTWRKWRAVKLMPHMSKQWINTQLRIAASPNPEEAAKERRDKNAVAERQRRQRQQVGGNHVVSASQPKPEQAFYVPPQTWPDKIVEPEQTVAEPAQTTPEDDSEPKPPYQGIEPPKKVFLAWVDAYRTWNTTRRKTARQVIFNIEDYEGPVDAANVGQPFAPAEPEPTFEEKLAEFAKWFRSLSVLRQNDVTDVFDEIDGCETCGREKMQKSLEWERHPLIIAVHDALASLGSETRRYAKDVVVPCYLEGE